MRHQGTEVLLRCWKCRKCVANSDCLINGIDSTNSQDGTRSSTDQEICNLWHLELEASPAWIKREIEKVHWAAGKLNCPYCRTRLGAFNFVDSTKCSCDRLAVIRLCKSKIDVDIRVIIQCPLLSASTSHTHFDKETRHGIEKHLIKNCSQILSTMDGIQAAPGTLVDALCLEVPAFHKHTEQSGKKYFFTLNVKKYHFASMEERESCSRNMFLRKSKSLDLDIKEQLLPKIYKNVKWTLNVKRRQSGFLLFSSASTSFNNNNYNSCHSLAINRSLEKFAESSDSSLRLSGETYNRKTPTRPGFEDVNGETSAAMSITPARSAPRGDSIPSPVDLPFQTMQSTLPRSVTVGQRLNKRELNKLKSLRRKQNKREKWLHGQKQINKSNITTEEDDEIIRKRESYTCAVCLDVYFNPYMCYPCGHIFCEPCLRTLARDNPTRTPCPLCRTHIARVDFLPELSKSSVDVFPNECLRRKQSFQRSNCAKWPLPSCNRLFRVFRDLRRHMEPAARRQFPHGGGHGFDFEEESRGWRFDPDMFIIYIFSVNWIIGFIFFCLLCYFVFKLLFWS